MAIEITTFIPILISLASVYFAIYFGVKNYRRSTKKDDQAEAANNTVLMIKMESLSSQILELKTEIKSEFSNIKADIKQDHEDIIILKRDAKTMWNIIDDLKIQIDGIRSGRKGVSNES